MVGLKAARYAIFAFVVSLLAAYPWVWGISYSKGNDFFYWVHFAWWVGLDFLREGLPDWTMLSGCGPPAFNLDHIHVGDLEVENPQRVSRLSLSVNGPEGSHFGIISTGIQLDPLNPDRTPEKVRSRLAFYREAMEIGY